MGLFTRISFRRLELGARFGPRRPTALSCSDTSRYQHADSSRPVNSSRSWRSLHQRRSVLWRPLSPVGTTASYPPDRQLVSFASRDALLAFTYVARTATYMPRKGRAPERSRTPSVVSCSRTVSHSRSSASVCPRPAACTRSLREPVHASAHRFARASCACAPLASVKPLPSVALLRFEPVAPPVRRGPSCPTRELLLRASFRSVSRFAAPRGVESHDAFDRPLPTISSMRAPAPRWFRFRVEACASPAPPALAHLAVNAPLGGLRLGENESSCVDRGVSVSRRSSRFGGHPCSAYWWALSSRQLRGCRASGISVTQTILRRAIPRSRRTLFWTKIASPRPLVKVSDSLRPEMPSIGTRTGSIARPLR